MQRGVGRDSIERGDEGVRSVARGTEETEPVSGSPADGAYKVTHAAFGELYLRWTFVRFATCLSAGCLERQAMARRKEEFGRRRGV